MVNVVLIEPEIPQNTGNIGRLCLAVGARLHLVGRLGFELSASRLKRAGLDYWEHLDVNVEPDVEAFLDGVPASAPKYFFTTKAGRTLYQCEFQEGSYLFFGKETAGLPDWILNRYGGDCVRIPLLDARVRSLNLANAVSIGVYEAFRQVKA